jgi:hypothetical protein
MSTLSCLQCGFQPVKGGKMEVYEARGPFLTLPLSPRGEIRPLEGMFTPSFTPGVNTLYSLEEWSGEQRISPPGDKIPPWGQSLPLGAKLNMGLWQLNQSYERIYQTFVSQIPCHNRKFAQPYWKLFLWQGPRKEDVLGQKGLRAEKGPGIMKTNYLIVHSSPLPTM